MISSRPVDFATVTLQKIRARGCKSRWRVGLTFTGVLVSGPSIGQELAIVQQTGNHRISTSAVLRVLRCDAHSVYVETEHSVYRLTFG